MRLPLIHYVEIYLDTYFYFHPFFALQDISDRIEKEKDDAAILKALQKSSIAVVRGDWKMHIGKELQDGMLPS